MRDLSDIFSSELRTTLSDVPEGYDSLVLAELARQAARDKGRSGPVAVLHLARSDSRLNELAEQLAFFAPDIAVLSLPAWDCLPYDRVSPNGDIVSRRMATLAALAGPLAATPRILLTTVNAALQRLPAREFVAAQSFHARPGDRIDEAALLEFLTRGGYTRASQVAEPGEFARRGGLIDIFPPGAETPLRLDMFGDELDKLRRFDPLTQRSIGAADDMTLLPVAEYALDPDSVRRFRKGYTEVFGALATGDPLYEAISEGRRYQGAEHWLPLFHDGLETVFDYCPGALPTLDHQATDAAARRLEAINDYYETRREAADAPATALSTPYRPLPPGRLYLTHDDLDDRLDERGAAGFTPFHSPDDAAGIAFAGRPGRNFAPERQDREINIYDALVGHVGALTTAGKRVVIATYAEGARQRLATVLGDHGLTATIAVAGWDELRRRPKGDVGLAVMALDSGFETDDLAVITEQDVLGDRLIRRSGKTRRADDFLRDAGTLNAGDLVVHIDHGVGRFEGLETITVSGAPHDCVALTYRGGDRLYVPVENIDVLSRYGSEDAGAELDKLGGQAWQAKKARMKQRIREMADDLIRIAAARALKPADELAVPAGIYDEFAARFPYAETEDQLRAIADVTADLAAGRPMDRLICGDVGFGKTEVALRAAFIAVMAGHQVAVIAPTTLLARQHYQTFTDRFRGLPVRIEQLSRLVGQKATKEAKVGLKSGDADIVIGTHALLGKSISFRRLGLVIVDEEQHFGVAHKERLKQLRTDVHVLTLTATPIPRTLQLAMTGIRDLSLIATPPVDRLAVRTFVMPFDGMVVREALLREHYRGGQSFYVAPRIADLEQITEFLREHVREIKFVVAHGQMGAGEIEDRMTAFYEGRYDVLVSTAIVESGLDIPAANTMIIHRADMFGLAQLYQLRGRVGRSKVRAYTYLTYRPNAAMTQTAQKRLEVLQSLDTLGAGFTLASHDMDIRGAGNLLGEEQSGHIREVGVELYQQMLEEAVAEARAGSEGEEAEGAFSPQINVGATVLIPEGYVGDLNLRMSLYRRLAELTEPDDIDAFAAELIDRFGDIPEEVEQLLTVIRIKLACLSANIAKLDAGPKGITVAFHKDRFPNPEGLVSFISKQGPATKLRPDHTLVYLARTDSVDKRLKVVLSLARGLARIAERATKAA